MAFPTAYSEESVVVTKLANSSAPFVHNARRVAAVVIDAAPAAR